MGGPSPRQGREVQPPGSPWVGHTVPALESVLGCDVSVGWAHFLPEAAPWMFTPSHHLSRRRWGSPRPITSLGLSFHFCK